MDNTKIASTNLMEFFRERVQEALEHQKLDSPPGVEFYLVNLLKEYHKADQLYTTTEEGRRQEPLALLFGQTLEADFQKKVLFFKKIGDLSLFTAGVFPASLDRKLVDVDYYIRMGCAAYGELSQLMNRKPSFEEIFAELARRFVAYVDILSEVSEKSEIATAADLLKIYENWLKTGSQRAKNLLSEGWIIPVPNVSLKPQ